MSNDVIEAARRHAEATGNDDLLALVTVHVICECSHERGWCQACNSPELLDDVTHHPDCACGGNAEYDITFNLDAFVAQAPEGLREPVRLAVYQTILGELDEELWTDEVLLALARKDMPALEAALLAAFGGAK